MEEQEIEKTTVKQISMKWGGILALASIIYFMILNIAGLTNEQAFSWLGSIITIVVIVLAHKQFKEDGNGFMSYGEGFKIGALVSIISALISSVFTFIYVKYIDGSMLDMAYDKALADLEEQGMSDAQIDQAMGFAEMFMTPTAMMIMGIIFGIIVGCILALIVTAFTKNNDPSLEL